METIISSFRQPQRVGLYAWGGPGTIRLIKTKYHSPKINEESFLSLYSKKTLQQLKKTFQITDAWVTYSWGFADQTEQEDYQFLRQHLDHFHQLGIRPHAYVQGFNLVTREFFDQDLFCRDVKGRLLPYSKGRSFTCPNNPHFQKLFLRRVAQASRENVAGVFIDNIIFGLPPLLVKKQAVSWFGCACQWCQKSFKSHFHETLPLSFHDQNILKKYLQFRRRSVLSLLTEAKRIIQQAGKEFGVNLYDPSLHQAEFFFGYHFDDLDPLLDYYLVENHSLAGYKKPHWRGNQDTVSFFPNKQKPLFIVSYEKGIGREKSFNTRHYSTIFQDAQQHTYLPCLKATEFTTKKIWHAMLTDMLSHWSAHSTVVYKHIPLRGRRKARITALTPSNTVNRWVMRQIARYYAHYMKLFFENKTVYLLLRSLFYSPKVFKQARLYSVDHIFHKKA